MQNTAYYSKNLPDQSPDSAREIFRQCLRQADRFIIEGKFELAKEQLAEAKKIDSRNPFIIAFEERISLFENKITAIPEKPKETPVESAEKKAETPQAPNPLAVHEQISREQLEQSLRQEIEVEYKALYTQELRKAEEQAAIILDEERRKIAQQQIELNGKFEQQLADARQRLQNDFQKKLDEEIANAEERLGQQHRSELSFIENEMKLQISKQYESELETVRQQISPGTNQTAEKQVQEIRDREHRLTAEFDRKLNESLLRTEEHLKQQHQLELASAEKQIKIQLTGQYENDLQNLQKQLKKREEETLLHEREAFKERERKLREQFNEKVLKALRKTEERIGKKQKAERDSLDSDMRAQIGNQHEIEIKALREQMKRSQDETLEKERQEFKERENGLRDQFNQKLLDALRKTEVMFHEQNRQQLLVEREQIEKELRDEYEKKLIAERESLQSQLTSIKSEIEATYREREGLAESEIGRRVEEQLEALRQKEEKKFQQRRAALKDEIETELQTKYEIQFRLEKEKIQQAADLALEAEKVRLENEYEKMIRAQNDQIQKFRSEMRSEMEQALLSRLEKIAHEYDHKMELLGAKLPDTKEDRFAFYRAKMLDCYQNGQPSVDDAKMLMRLKEMLELTFDDHLSVESDVRLDLYVKKVERKILSGELNALNANALEILKQQFNITPEESTRLEPYILQSFERIATKGRLLVVDDDEMLLQSLDGVLTDSGFQVITASDIIMALEKLKSTPFDLILSDIKFANGELDGFKFFKAVQEQPFLRTIPFIFMSALLDGVIIRSGVQLGVDDYITKPMDPDLLVATIEGKLKRYKNLRNSN